MKKQILLSLIKRELDIRHQKPKYTRCGFSARGYVQILNRQRIIDLIKDYRAEI